MRNLHLLWLLPLAWIDGLLIKSQPWAKKANKMRYWLIQLMRWLKVKIKIINPKPLPQGILIVSNHQGTLDPIYLSAVLTTNHTYVSKTENLKVPMIGRWARNIDMIVFDRDQQSSAIKMIREVTRRLQQQQSVVIFPEGTRSHQRMPLTLQPGALKAAYLAHAPIVPIVLHDAYLNFKPLLINHEYQLTIGEIIPYEEYRHLDINQLTNQIQLWMEQELEK
jgi:1-acyl-sn-glycerol-3-phosphate acyltransferase